MLGLRESFGAKLLAGLLATAGVLLVVTFVVVRAETRAQEADVSEQTVASALAQFNELEAIKQEQADRLARPLVDEQRGRQQVELFIRSGGTDSVILGEFVYQIDFSGLLGVVLVTITDSDGEVVGTILPDGSSTMDDPLQVGSLARQLIDGVAFDLTAYRAFEGRLYNTRVRVIETPGGRLLGTIAFALPEDDADIERIGGLFGVEVCYAIDGACVAGTAMARGELSEALPQFAATAEAVTATAANTDWSIRAAELVPDRPEEGSRVIAVPLDAIRVPFERIIRALFLGGALSLAMSILIGLRLSRGLTKPVQELVEATAAVARGDYETEVQVTSRDEIGKLALSFNDMTRGLLMKERYRSVLNKVVSQDVATELMKGDVELGGENRTVSVLFADIRGFSSITEGMEPQMVIGFLNECMERLSDAVEAEGGVVDKYVGDEIMAVFGAPAAQEAHALRAVCAAVRMRSAIADLNEDRERRGEAPIGIGVGVSTGVAVAGNMGSADRLNYTVLGDIVNLGARLCSGAVAGEILITERTHADAGDAIQAESRGARPFKGFSQDIEVFGVIGLREGATTGEPNSTSILR